MDHDYDEDDWKHATGATALSSSQALGECKSPETRTWTRHTWRAARTGLAVCQHKGNAA